MIARRVEQVLCIGGAADGEKVHVRDWVQNFEVTDRYERHHYEIFQFAGKERTFQLAIWDGISVDTAIEMLVSSYKKKEVSAQR